mmetsp:Transcript_16173/g.36992  ORF Transcript_16173/g.36992 Transcript_16173/m.36992 type:complete len:118 (-) Transcript_16173:967-1320(-)
MWFLYKERPQHACLHGGRWKTGHRKTTSHSPMGRMVLCRRLASPRQWKNPHSALDMSLVRVVELADGGGSDKARGRSGGVGNASVALAGSTASAPRLLNGDGTKLEMRLDLPKPAEQ